MALDVIYFAALAWLAIAGILAERDNRRLRRELAGAHDRARGAR